MEVKFDIGSVILGCPYLFSGNMYRARRANWHCLKIEIQTKYFRARLGNLFDDPPVFICF